VLAPSSNFSISDHTNYKYQRIPGSLFRVWLMAVWLCAQLKPSIRAQTTMATAAQFIDAARTVTKGRVSCFPSQQSQGGEVPASNRCRRRRFCGQTRKPVPFLGFLDPIGAPPSPVRCAFQERIDSGALG